MALGPFEIAVEQIEALGLRFTPFVNRLLAIEWRAAGLSGATPTISSQENVADGGVDAATRDAVAAGWIPAGSTAWQFKRTNLDPKECERELRRATWAHEFLRQGGSYVLVLGKGLTDERIVARREKLVAVAIELGLLSQDDPNRIRVYDGNRLAQWASEHPSLVISGLAGGLTGQDREAPGSNERQVARNNAALVEALDGESSPLEPVGYDDMLRGICRTSREIAI